MESRAKPSLWYVGYVWWFLSKDYSMKRGIKTNLIVQNLTQMIKISNSVSIYLDIMSRTRYFSTVIFPEKPVTLIYPWEKNGQISIKGHSTKTSDWYLFKTVKVIKSKGNLRTASYRDTMRYNNNECGVLNDLGTKAGQQIKLNKFK